jgi:low density lipoprotein receptor-related protein 5/6
MTHKKIKYKSGNLPFSIYSSSATDGYAAEMAIAFNTPIGTSSTSVAPPTLPASKIYWGDGYTFGLNSSIGSASINPYDAATSGTMWVTGTATGMHISVDSYYDKIYWCARGLSEDAHIYTASLDGTNSGSIYTKASELYEIVAIPPSGSREGKIVFGVDNHEIHTASLDGTNSGIILQEAHSYLGSALSYGAFYDKIYFQNRNTQKIETASLDGTLRGPICDSATPNTIYSIAVGYNYGFRGAYFGELYWGFDAGTSGSIYGTSLSNPGAGPFEILTQPDDSIRGLSVDPEDERLYWTNTDADKIYSASAEDGSELGVFIDAPGHYPISTDLYQPWIRTYKLYRESAGFDITNIHEDTYGDIKGAPLQGPFTYQYVGGNQHRHVPLNKGGDSILPRPELFRINMSSSGEITVTNPAYSYLTPMESAEVVVAGTSFIGDVALDLDAGKIYWSDRSDNDIKRADLSGDNEEIIVSGLNTPRGIALDVNASKIYWVDSGTEKIQRANTSVAATPEDLIDLSSEATTLESIALDIGANKMYWVDSGTDTIRRANMEVSATPEDLITSGIKFPFGIGLDISAGKMYWADFSVGISRADLDGDNVEILMEVGNPYGIALDVSAGKMYWTDYIDQVVRRSNLDGTVVETLISLTTNEAALGIALDIDAGKMYWGENSTEDNIKRANMSPYFPASPVPYTRGETAKRPVNIANHQTYNPLGNYTYDYEIIQTVGRTSNNRAFVEATSGAYAPGFIGDPTLPYSGSMITQFVSGARDPLTGTALPVFGSDETVFVNRFSAPGGTEVSSRGALDTYAEEYAPNNDINVRNRSVRSVLRSDLAEHTPDLNLATLSGSTKYHTDYRNPKLDFAEPSASLSASDHYPSHVVCNPEYSDLIYQEFSDILIEPTNDLDNDELGFAVSVTSGSDGVYAVAGAPGDTVSAATTNGAAVLYRHVASIACNQKTLEFSHISQTVITASDGDTDDNFGYATAVVSGSDGVYILVGAQSADSGAGKAYLYHSRSSGFEIPRDEQILTASDSAAGDRFGWSVSLASASNGIHAMVGAPYAEIGGSDWAGRAYIYHSTSAGFEIPRDEAKFQASDAAYGASFGTSVSLWAGEHSFEGTTSNMYALVGAPYTYAWGPANGKAYIYQSHIETFGDVTTFSNTGVLDDDMTSVDTHIDCADDATATNREGDYCCSFASGSGVRLLQWDNMFGIGNLTVELKVLKGINGANGPCPYLSNAPEAADDLRIQYSTDGATWSDFTTNAEIDQSSFDYDNWLPHTASVDLAVPAYVRVAQPSHSNNAMDQWAIQNLRITSADGWEIPSGWEQILTASDGADDDRFGYSVSVAVGAWGIYSLVGAPEHGDSYDEGQAYLYHSQSAVANVPEVIITSPHLASSAANFGHSCAIISPPPSLHQNLRFVIGQYADSSDLRTYEYDAPNESLSPFADTSLFRRRPLARNLSTTRLGKAVSIVSGSGIEDTIKFLGAPRSAAASTTGDCVLYISASEQKSYTVYSSSYDNAYVTHAIPRASLDYSWINASAITTKTQLPGYQNSSSY